MESEWGGGSGTGAGQRTRADGHEGGKVPGARENAPDGGCAALPGRRPVVLTGNSEAGKTPLVSGAVAAGSRRPGTVGPDPGAARSPSPARPANGSGPPPP